MRARAILCACFFVATLIGCAGGGSSPSASSVDPDETAAQAGLQFAKKLVSPHLKSPTTAEFPREEAVATRLDSVTDNAGDTAKRWRVRGVVDAQNALGVALRYKWEIIVLLLNETFFPVEASLDGTVIFVSEQYQSTLANIKERESRKTAADVEDRRAKESQQHEAKRRADAERAEQKQRDEKPARDAKEAAALMDLAKQLSKAGKEDKAIERLRKIIEQYPDTPSAKEARELLKKIDG